MPTVRTARGTKHYPYTKKGRQMAQKARATMKSKSKK